MNKLTIDDLDLKDKKVLVIYATILVKRNSQKSIVIGKKGDMIKKIGASARKDIEEIYEKKVYLDLWVKVDPKWMEKNDVLRRLGYFK